jgi:uncharacterized DUF497 family protein
LAISSRWQNDCTQDRISKTEYQWDPEKAVINLVKNGVTFHEATTVFDDRNCVTGYDPNHSDEEERFISAGISNLGRLLIVWHTDRGDVIRIIGARTATKRERNEYTNG